MAENTPTPSGSIREQLKDLLHRLLNIKDEKAPEEETIQSIKDGVDFYGAKLWILILAIFTASLGLNTNSAAVIIGAMLISPLMGPIIGMGLGMGINDFELFKRSFRSYLTATAFSVLTSTVYFIITPVAEAQSELLARTSPNIYDVFIALCGGLAGIIALSSTSQRGGNVIPGVAIATALMPPLCTTGFGLGTGNWMYAIGAFYLYLINTIFISLATFIGVRAMHFKPKVFVDKQREKRVKHILVTIAVVTILPASLFTYQLVRETAYTKKANDFINNELTSESTQIIGRQINHSKRTIRVVSIGCDIGEKELTEARRKLEDYGLTETELNVIQGAAGVDVRDLRSMVQNQEHNAPQQIEQNARLLAGQQKQIRELETRLQPYERNEQLAASLSQEIKTLFPEIKTLSLGRSLCYTMGDTTRTDTMFVACMQLERKLNIEANTRLRDWLVARVKTDKVKIVLEMMPAETKEKTANPKH
ncbi:MAG: TIGR00341 family protein [Clostridium sp.]|nr:TIGR00341 family protein [Clostridium sp.]